MSSLSAKDSPERVTLLVLFETLKIKDGLCTIIVKLLNLKSEL